MPEADVLDPQFVKFYFPSIPEEAAIFVANHSCFDDRTVPLIPALNAAVVDCARRYAQYAGLRRDGASENEAENCVQAQLRAIIDLWTVRQFNPRVEEPRAYSNPGPIRFSQPTAMHLRSSRT